MKNTASCDKAAFQPSPPPRRGLLFSYGPDKRMLNNDMELHFLEVPKFTKKAVKEMTCMERWLDYESFTQTAFPQALNLDIGIQPNSQAVPCILQAFSRHFSLYL